MVRIVLDTNVIINADKGEGSYGKRILDLVRWEEVEAVISDPVKREKQIILDRLVSDPVLRQAVKGYFNRAINVPPVKVDVKLEDEEDLKLLELAVGGQAEFLITDDRHLLVLQDLGNIKIVTPKEFWQWWEVQQDKTGNTWQSWATNIFGK